MSKIGVFLGTFNPMHIGHIWNIVNVLNEKCVDKVVIVPAKQNPWKKEKPISFEHRMKICGLCAAEINKNFDEKKVFVSDIESKCLESHSWFVLQKLYEDEYPDDELHILCGDDVAKDIPFWTNGGWIYKNFSPIITNRDFKNVLSPYTPLIQISSTEIRNMIKDGLFVFPFLTESVLSYINNNNLYKN